LEIDLMSDARKAWRDRIDEQGLKLPEKQAESLHAFAMTAIETAIRNYWQAKARADDAQRRFDSEAAILEAMAPQIGKDLGLESHWQYQRWADTFATTFDHAETELVDAPSSDGMAISPTSGHTRGAVGRA
jgi:hypothetical protein